jgi:hypothetical protein
MALFGCSFAHGQQDVYTTSIPAFGKQTQTMPTPALILTSLSPPIPPTTNNIAQQQEQIIGSDLVVPSPGPSLPMDQELIDKQRFQPQGEQTSETQLTAEEEQSQQITVDETLKDPRAQSKLMEEEKEKAELEIKQRLDDIGAGEERNNQEDTSSDTTNDNEPPLDLKLPVPFP